MTPNERIPIESKGSWLDMRRRDVTASQIAALWGHHPYLTALELYRQKRGEDGNQGDNPSMRRGRWLEPAILEAVKDDNPEWAPLIHKATDYWRLPEQRLGSTPDAFIGTPGDPTTGVLELKSMLPEKFATYGETAPLHHSLQVAVQMMTTGASWGTIAIMVMTRNLDLRLFAVPRIAAVEAKITADVAAFWDRVDRGDPPPPVLPQDYETLIRMFPRDNGSSLDLNGDNELPGLLAERASLKVATKRLAEIDTAIKAKIGEAATAFCSDWRISYRAYEKAEYTVPAKVVRSLRITRAKNGNGDDE
jgi:predicted phage-related endonuclease